MNILQHRFSVNFPMAKSIFEIHSLTSLTFNIIEMHGKHVDIKETVVTKMTEIRPYLFMVTWKEANGNTITQIHDYEREIIYSNWTTPKGDFINSEGTIKLIDNN